MYKTITRCRCCGNEHLFKYLDLGEQPLANSYHKGEDLPRFPLQVMLCEQCFHSQLSVVVEPALMFKHYLYVSGTTHTFRKHCEELAQDAVSRAWVKTPRVLDIACNDGTLLSIFKYLGCDVQGIDPAENLRTLSEEKNIPVRVAYWRKNASLGLGKFDIITGTNVFAHVDDIQEFLNECAEALSPEGMVILEFPYCDQLITHCEFDTIYHEHLSYFLATSFATLAKITGFNIVDIKQSPIHGGSIRFYLQRFRFGHIWRMDDLVIKECRSGLLSKSAYVQFAQQIQQTKQDMNALLAKLRAEGKKVVGFGAAAKGNTMLNHFEIDLDYIVDDNQMKWDYLTPGRNIPIKPTGTLVEEAPDLYVLILSWNFWDEIVRKVEQIRGTNTTHYIRYVPKVEVI